MSEAVVVNATVPAQRSSSTQPRILPANLGFRVWVTKHPIGGALISGFVATHLATVFGVWFHGIGLPDLNWPVANGAVIDPKGSFVAQWMLGEFVHGFDGLVFTLMFALFIFPLFKFGNSSGANMGKAMIFALVLGTISAGILVPYVYFPHDGVGFFTNNLGWKEVFAIYLWHVIFGFNLGALYNPLALDDPLLSE
jgi:hypothetical protein